MAVNFTNKQKEIIRKIIYAVETGGQIYGKVGYDNFTEAYTNSPAEHAITIGGGAWYATEAKKLLNLIRKTYPSKFKALDTQGISNDLDKKNWSVYKLSKNSEKAKCIISIIGSSEGIKCQDILMDNQINDYASIIQSIYGDMSVDAIAECINIKHQGGDSALKRILAKTTKPYSAKTIYDALCTDPDDKSNNNQVGDYTSRQKKVYEMINSYLIPTIADENITNSSINKGGTAMATEAINALINVAKNEVGYLEKKSGSSLDNKTANAGSNNYTKYWRDINNWGLGNYQAQYWCAAFVFWCFVKAFGLTTAKKLLYHAPYIYCPTAGSLFKKNGRLYSSPKVGDVVVFMGSKGVFSHTGIVYKVDSTYFYTIEGNTSSASGVVANGGAVEYKTYSISTANNKGHKFCRPDYSIVTSVSDTTSPSTNTSANKTIINKYNKVVDWTGIVTANELNVRTLAGTENPKCSFSPLKKNEEVGVCDSAKDKDGSTWYYIKYNNKFGFVSSKYIKKKKSNASSTSSVTNNKTDKVEYAESYLKSIAGTYMTTAKLNLRNGAGTNKNILCVIPKGSKVSCYGYYTSVNNIKWYFVSYNNYNGFVSSKYIKKLL